MAGQERIVPGSLAGVWLVMREKKPIPILEMAFMRGVILPDAGFGMEHFHFENARRLRQQPSAVQAQEQLACPL